MVAHVYLSPHLDDAVFSCGGLIARQTANDEKVTVVTICAGDTPVGELTPFAVELHRRWGGAGSPIAARRAEDRMACGRLGASAVHLEVPDAVYRRDGGQPMYVDEPALFASLHPADSALIARLAALLEEKCPAQARLYCPSVLGGHVDHRLTRMAAERLARPLWYYQDMPYAARGGVLPADLPLPTGIITAVPLVDEEVQQWIDAIGEYRSQLSSFWPTENALYRELTEMLERSGGLRFLRPAGQEHAFSVAGDAPRDLRPTP
jgi:LmbE family N-acetylglucosaminyl deacetylase